MVTLVGAPASHWMVRPHLRLWPASVAMLTLMVALLAIAIKINPYPSQDLAIMDWVAGWNIPGLAGFLNTVSFLTSKTSGVVIGITGTAALLIMRKTRGALEFAVVGAAVGAIAVLGDYTLGEAVGRARPLGDNPAPSFPSGHVFGATVFFGYLGFLAVYHGLRMRILVPTLALLATIIVAVGPARIYEQAHWPSDVAAGYLLGGLWLLVIIPLFLKFRSMTAVSSPSYVENLAPLATLSRAPVSAGAQDFRVERSIASVVTLDPRQGTATKVYRPPAIIRALYWLAFQARFPYEGNIAALQAADYRRKIASMLTIHRFGKDLVSPVTAIEYRASQSSFVTKYIPGEKVKNDAATKYFLARVSETFSEAGLSVWQINPRNPHAHTNLIRTPEGDFKIIDLESAIVTPIPARGQWRSAFKSGYFPIFDDIDFERLRQYAGTHRTSLESSLGPEGMAELRNTLDRGEQALRSWKDAEPRIWGRLASLTYRLFNWKPLFQRIASASAGADQAADAFLSKDIDRWKAEGRLSPFEATNLRTYLSTSEVRDAMHHLGAHLVLTALFRFPFGSAVRLLWTVAFWGSAQSRSIRSIGKESAGKPSNIHTPLVMALSIVPGFGAIAYLAARPLRRKLLVRLVLDQIGWKLPFKLHERMRMSRWIPPQPARVPTRMEESYAYETLPEPVLIGGDD